MRIDFVDIQNFRKLKSCRIDFSNKQTIFVGPNNSGKTSAMDALMFFLTDRGKFSTRDFTLSNWLEINKIATKWLVDFEGKDGVVQNDEYWQRQLTLLEAYLPQLDLWLNVNHKEVHYVHQVIPSLDWKGGLLGLRMRLEPTSIEKLFKEFKADFEAASSLTKKKEGLDLWPKHMWAYLDHPQKLSQLFSVQSYVLDPEKLGDLTSQESSPQQLPHKSIAIEKEVLKGLIRVNTINAQRGHSNEEQGKLKPLSTQFRAYYENHLNPEDKPNEGDLEALKAIATATQAFDDKLKESFSKPLEELGDLNYPGFGNPNITISSVISAIQGLDHKSSVQFELNEKGVDVIPLSLPEYTNGLGYQNLISMVFELIRFRDEWMKVGKRAKSDLDEDPYEPLHLVLIEEPEAHLHAQIQQVFINKAYAVLRANPNLGENTQFTTQVVVSTHSNHVAHEVEFKSLRYFKRILPAANQIATSRVVNLSKTFGSENETTKFAIRYLKSTHCDLFFADAVIMVEGSAERILIPHFIRQPQHKELRSSYISIIEIGGSHAHKLKPLIETLELLALVVTDLDPIDPNNHRKHARPSSDGLNLETDNSTLKDWLPLKQDIDSLLSVTSKDKISSNGKVRVAYQYRSNTRAIPSTKDIQVCSTSFEDAIVYSNIGLFSELKGSGLIQKFRDAISGATDETLEEKVYDALRRSSSGEKAAFALELLFQQDPASLNIPQYIEEGLTWLEEKLNAGKPA